MPLTYRAAAGAAITRATAAQRAAAWPAAASPLAASTVCWISMAVVTGPTPPGTGVSRPAMPVTAAASTSPARPPSGAGLVPTSITTVPGATKSAPISPARRPHQHLGFAAHRGQVPGPRVADGHGGIPGQQQQRGGLAHHDGPADHHSAAATQ